MTRGIPTRKLRSRSIKGHEDRSRRGQGGSEAGRGDLRLGGIWQEGGDLVVSRVCKLKGDRS